MQTINKIFELLAKTTRETNNLTFVIEELDKHDTDALDLYETIAKENLRVKESIEIILLAIEKYQINKIQKVK